MKTTGRSPGAKRRWLISALCAGAVVVMVLAMFRPAARPLATSTPGRAASTRVTVTRRQYGELALRDLTPLFLPTPYNAAPTEPVERAPGRNILDVDRPKMRFADDDPGIQLPPPFRAPAAAMEALAESPGPLATGIGRSDVRPPVTRPHGALVEVFAPSGESVFTQPLDLNTKPKSTDRVLPEWRPLEFVAAIDAAGLVGQLALTTSSGSEEVDNHFRNYLARSFRIGDRLTPGFYRIVVGP